MDCAVFETTCRAESLNAKLRQILPTLNRLEEQSGEGLILYFISQRLGTSSINI